MKKFGFNYVHIIAIFYLSILEQSFAQSIVKDPRGQSTLSVNPGFKATDKASVEDKSKIDTVSFNLGLLKFTTSEKKIDLNYYSFFVPKNSIHHFFVGVSAGGAIKNSLATLFSTNNLASEAEATLRTGVRLLKSSENWPALFRRRGKSPVDLNDPDAVQAILDNYTHPASDLWFVLNGTFSGSKFKLFKPDLTFDKQIEETKFSGYEFSAGLNYWNARVLDQTILAGATIGIKQTNNFDELTEGTREDTRTINDATTNTTRKIVVKEAVFTGDYKVNKVYPLNFDLYCVPQNAENIGLLGYSRTNFGKDILAKTKLGVGIFFLKNQNAFNPLAGLIFEYDDAFNVDPKDDDKNSISKLKISITTRLTIINNQKRQ